MATLLKQILDQLGTLKQQDQNGLALVVVLSMFLSFSLVVASMMGNGTRSIDPPNPSSIQRSL